MRAEFDIIGRIGNIKKFDGATRISIATTYRIKDNNGQWNDDPYWNEIVIFNERTRKYIDEKIGIGDKVAARGRMRSKSYEKDGEKHYTTDLVANEFQLMAKKREDTQDDQQPTEG